MMGIETVSLMIAAFVHGSLGIAALMRNFRSRLCVSFALLSGIIFAHDSLSFLEGFSSDDWTSPRLHTLAVLAAGPFSLWLLRRLTPLYQKPLQKVVYGYVAILAVCSPFVLLPAYDRVSLLLSIFSHALFLFPAAVWVFTLAGAVKHTQLTRERVRLRYAFWGAVATIAFFLTNALRFAGFAVPPLGTLARTLYFMFLFQTFVQRELMTSEEVVAKMALFGGIALMLSTIYLLLVSWVGDKPDLFFFNTFIASFVIIVLFDPIRKLTMKLTRKLFLRRNTMLEDELNGLSQNLMGVVEPLEVWKRLNSSLKRAIDIEASSLYLLERDALSYVRVDLNPGDMTELSSSSPLVEYMTLRGGKPFLIETIENDRESFRSAPPRRFCQSCVETMRTLQADLVIPFLHESRLVGFCIVRTGERVVLSNEQLRLFIPLARQVALSLRNAQTFHFMRDRDKLAAVGEMAAGLAHEIKNPLGAIKGAAELLGEELRGKEPVPAEFLKIIVDETNRLSGVLTDFLDYAKPRRVDPLTKCDVVRVMEHTAAMILRDRRISVEISADRDAVAVQADPEALKQVLLNLLLNAVQAMDGFTERPSLRMKVREIRPRRLFPFADSLPIYKVWEGWDTQSVVPGRPYVEIAVEDNGPGISIEDSSRIFLPFFTTKPKGTGLGLAICQRLVGGMGGTIHVKANQPAGSVFVLHLPLKREEASP